MKDKEESQATQMTIYGSTAQHTVPVYVDDVAIIHVSLSHWLVGLTRAYGEGEHVHLGGNNLKITQTQNFSIIKMTRNDNHALENPC